MTGWIIFGVIAVLVLLALGWLLAFGDRSDDPEPCSDYEPPRNSATGAPMSTREQFESECG